MRFKVSRYGVLRLRASHPTSLFRLYGVSALGSARTLPRVFAHTRLALHVCRIIELVSMSSPQ